MSWASGERSPGQLRAFAQRVQARRGMSVAMVAVARRLCVIVWHVLTKHEDYAFARPWPARIDIVLRHVALAVADEQRSRGFYERYLGFGARPPKRYPDGVLMLFDGRGSALALGPRDNDASLPTCLHFGYVYDSPQTARETIARFKRDGVEFLKSGDDDDDVGCKVADPDGYVVEVFWEAGWELRA